MGKGSGLLHSGGFLAQARRLACRWENAAQIGMLLMVPACLRSLLSTLKESAAGGCKAWGEGQQGIRMTVVE